LISRAFEIIGTTPNSPSFRQAGRSFPARLAEGKGPPDPAGLAALCVLWL